MLIAVIPCEPRRCQQDYSALARLIRARQSADSDVNVQKGVASSLLNCTWQSFKLLSCVLLIALLEHVLTAWTAFFASL